jgi:DNA-binding CsgD family transcriptional regulator
VAIVPPRHTLKSKVAARRRINPNLLRRGAQALDAIIATRPRHLGRTTQLSDREVATLTWAGVKTSSDIAQTLGPSKPTVDFHIDNARKKLGVAARTEAAIKAAAGRLIEP